MPNGFWYAAGPCDTAEAVPASAFSKGDLITLDSNSSFSRINELMVSGNDIFGVAEGDSTQSLNGRVTVRIPEDDTQFWASLDTALTSHVTPGVEMDVLFSTANNRYYVTTASANSVRAVCVRGTTGVGAIDQSVQSKVLIRFIKHAGNFEL